VVSRAEKRQSRVWKTPFPRGKSPFPFVTSPFPSSKRGFPTLNMPFPYLTRSFPLPTRSFPHLSRWFPTHKMVFQHGKRGFPFATSPFPSLTSPFPFVTRSFPDGKRGFPRVIYAVLQGFGQIHPPTRGSRAISVPFLDTQEDGRQRVVFGNRTGFIAISITRQRPGISSRHIHLGRSSVRLGRGGPPFWAKVRELWVAVRLSGAVAGAFGLCIGRRRITFPPCSG
jgi:hypothetical protein